VPGEREKEMKGERRRAEDDGKKRGSKSTCPSPANDEITCAADSAEEKHFGPGDSAHRPRN